MSSLREGGDGGGLGRVVRNEGWLGKIRFGGEGLEGRMDVLREMEGAGGDGFSVL